MSDIQKTQDVANYRIVCSSTIRKPEDEYVIIDVNTRYDNTFTVGFIWHDRDENEILCYDIETVDAGSVEEVVIKLRMEGRTEKFFRTKPTMTGFYNFLAVYSYSEWIGTMADPIEEGSK